MKALSYGILFLSVINFLSCNKRIENDKKVKIVQEIINQNNQLRDYEIIIQDPKSLSKDDGQYFNTPSTSNGEQILADKVQTILSYDFNKDGLDEYLAFVYNKKKKYTDFLIIQQQKYYLASEVPRANVFEQIRNHFKPNRLLDWAVTSENCIEGQVGFSITSHRWDNNQLFIFFENGKIKVGWEKQ